MNSRVLDDALSHLSDDELQYYEDLVGLWDWYNCS